MKKLYLAAVEAGVGKTLVSVGLARALGARGLSVDWRKPVGYANTYWHGRPFDRDAEVVSRALGLTQDPEALVPVLGGEAPRAWRPPAGAWERIEASLVTEAEVLILEGREWLGRGLCSGLSDVAIAAKFSAPILLLARYQGEPTVDRVLGAVRLLGREAQPLGLVLNEISVDAELEEAQGLAAPFLEERGVPVLGMIPFERRLRTARLDHVVEALGGEVVVSGNLSTEVERFLVGAMGGEAALQHLRRIPGQLAVVTGGDRADIQAAALTFPRVRALILTGGLRPDQAILTQAAQREVPVLVVPQDTMTAAETAERLVGQAPLASAEKLSLVDELVAEGVELDRLLDLCS